MHTCTQLSDHLMMQMHTQNSLRAFVHICVCIYIHTQRQICLPYTRAYAYMPRVFVYTCRHVHTHVHNLYWTNLRSLHAHTHTKAYIKVWVYPVSTTKEMYCVTHVDTHIHACTQYTHIHACTHTYTRVHTHTRVYTHIHACTHTYTRVHTHTRVHIGMYEFFFTIGCVWLLIFKKEHAYIPHTYTVYHTHVQICSQEQEHQRHKIFARILLYTYTPWYDCDV